MIERSERWRRVESLCQAALERPVGERDAFLRAACGDAHLRHDVETLLRREAAAQGFLEGPVGAAVARLIQGPSLSGRRLGAFEVGPLLGAGGMGDVYRARDVDLNRDVALKILPVGFALDPDRVARFKREAQVLASLNHPNVAAIHGFEEADGVQALVLELVEGPTLADRLAHGPIPLVDALPIARQIAEGLEAAHERGIVHRDLKPANVKVRADGTVKVLDFGLAKVLQPDPATSGDPTSARTITRQSMAQAGVLLGTAAYMSPEQARGREADKRSDIWAFGAVLYEMLSGEMAFEGDDAFDTLAAVVGRDIAWHALPASTPPSVRRLLGRCLDRELRHRLRDIGEARIVLEDTVTSAGGTRRSDASIHGESLAERVTGKWMPRRRSMTLAGAVLVIGALGAGLWSVSPSSRHDVTRLSFALPEGQTLSTGDRSISAISPDGTQLVYVAAPSGLYLRAMAAFESRAIGGSEGHVNVGEPVFSPDGRWIAFFSLADSTLKRMPVTGGAPVTICHAVYPSGVSWGADGILFVESGTRIMRVASHGGSPMVLIRLHEGEAAQRPQMLPGGRHLLFSLAVGAGPDRWDKARVVVQSLASGERKTLLEGGSDARYVPTGHLVYAVGGSLFAVSFDARRLQVTSAAVPLIGGVRRAAADLAGGAQFSFANNGSLIYIPGPISAQWDLALTDRTGGVEPLKLPPGAYEAPRVSPDGSRIAFGTDDGREATVWIYELSGATTMKALTFGSNNRFPTWSSDSRRVAFQSDREGDAAIFWQSTNGGPAERLTRAGRDEAHEPEDWSPKGDTLLYSVTKGSVVSLWTLSMTDRRTAPFGDVRSSIRTGAVFSPDGRWVAYASWEGSRKTIHVQPFPPTGDTYQLLQGTREPKHPRWSPDGKELFYNPGPGQFESVSVTMRPGFAFGARVTVPRPFPGAAPFTRRPYDVTPDGRFVSAIAAGQSRFGRPAAPQIQVVLNWFEELRTRVPAATQE